MVVALLIIILAYLFFSFSSFGDKLILSGSRVRQSVNPRLYTFYIGMLGILVVAFIPFAGLVWPSQAILPWIILEAAVFLVGLLALFKAVEKFEVSRVVPVVGAFQPIFVLLLTWLFWGFQPLSGMEFLAFALLIAGSIIISMEKKPQVTLVFLCLTILCSFLIALDYTLSKVIFLELPFLQGLIWMRVFTFAFALLFLLSRKFRKEMFSGKTGLNKKNVFLLVFTQSSGAVAGILQSLAISLVSVAYLPIINSLRGVQYVFLFILTSAFSFFFPKVLKEEISKKVLLQKVAGIIIIVVGLAILIY